MDADQNGARIISRLSFVLLTGALNIIKLGLFSGCVSNLSNEAAAARRDAAVQRGSQVASVPQGSGGSEEASEFALIFSSLTCKSQCQGFLKRSVRTAAALLQIDAPLRKDVFW